MSSQHLLTQQRRRPPVRQLAITADLRRDIVEGTHPPGSRLPTRVHLERRYRASTITVQRALDDLAKHGFIEARGTRGTFVSHRPPHLHQYALVFPPARSGDRRFWSKFWIVLERVAETLSHDPDRRMSVLFGAEGKRHEQDYAHLRDAVGGQRLAGLIFSGNPFQLRDDPDVWVEKIPRVCVGDKAVLGCMMIDVDGPAFMSRALEHLASRGRRNIGLFYIPLPTHMSIGQAFFRETIRNSGMSFREPWIQPCAFPAEHARYVAHLMGTLPPGERPDGLIISDDNLEEHVVAGLLAAGVRLPEDIEIVSHANFPSPTPRPAPLRRLGLDCRELLETSMDLIARARRGEAVPELSVLPPRFEDELTATRVAAR